MAKARKLIVGVDPGTTAGIAVFDLNGNLIVAESIRNPGREVVIERILKHGIPVVVATDMHTPPEFVAQLASNFNARLFYPDKDMLQREKEEIARELVDKAEGKLKLNDAHERDAAAAAVNFIRHYKNKMAWIERNVREKGLDELEDEIKKYVLQGVPLGKVVNYLTAKDEITEKEERGEKGVVIAKKKDELAVVSELIDSNARMRSLLSVVSAENKMLSERLRDLHKEFHSDARYERVLKSKDMQISRLRTLLRRQTNEMVRIEKSLKMMKQTGDKGLGKQKKPEAESLENIVEEYREERE